MNRERLEAHRLNNLFHSILMILGMVVIMAVLGLLVMGWEGIFLAFVVGVGIMLLSPGVSPRAVLRMYRARQLTPQEAPALFTLLNELARRAELSRPPVLYYVPSQILNAFAVGNQNTSAVALTDGMLRTLNLRELAGVLAHEVSHIRHNDLWVMGLADVVGRVTSAFSFFGQVLLFINLPLLLLGGYTINWLAIAVLILSPSITTLLQLSLSRSREFDADNEAAELSGDPLALASALKKMEQRQGSLWERIFMPGRREPHPSLLRTHPQTQERIGRLLELADVEPRAAKPSVPEPEHHWIIHPDMERINRRPSWWHLGFWY